MRAAAPRDGASRIHLLSYLDDLLRFGEREAYLWREGVRWRTRTYREMHRRVAGCASALRGAGLAGGEAVILQGPESAGWVEALFGILAAGGVVVPLDAATPFEIRERVARKARARLLVAPAGLAPPEGAGRVDLDSWDGAPEGGTFASPGPDDPAEILFTSGTTGDPKGVVLTHRNLLSDFAPIERGFRRYEHWTRRVGRLRFLSTLPLSHMFGQALGVFLPLTMGLTVVFTPARPREVLEAARARTAWGLFTVPRLLDLLAAEVRRRQGGPRRLERFERRRARLAGRPFPLQAIAFAGVQHLFGWRFRLIVAGGAPLPETLQQFWESLGYLVVQGYGLTETAPIISISNPFERRAGSVGRPLSGQEVRLGADGEVLVRGANVTPGYLGAGEAADGGGWFRTGDLGEIDARGRLRIRGRVKDVIVTAEGENVHPGDVEAAFEGAPGVREASVFGLPGGGGDRVHAALLLEPAGDAAAAVSHANERLLPKQRVRGFTVWPDDDFPRTATGKIRKAILRERVAALEAAATPAAAAAGAPRPDGVRRLVAAVARVRAETLQPGTRLAQGLGLASLDLLELAVAVEEEYGVGLPEERLAEFTVGDLERFVARAARTTAPGTARAAASAAGAPSVDPGPAPAAPGEGTSAADDAAPAGGEGAPPPRWARRAPVHLARRVLEETLYRAVMRLYARPRVRGLENLSAADPPFLFVANHHGVVDTGLFKTLLPRPLRGRIAPGMTTRHHRLAFREARGPLLRRLVEWTQVRLVEFLFHAWPLPETAGVRASLAYAGELADAGFSILIYPEGRHVPEGSSEPFRKGIGLFARELRLPVVPALVAGTSRVFPDGAWWPRLGRAILVLGPPLRIDPDADAAAATRAIEAAVRALRP